VAGTRGQGPEFTDAVKKGSGGGSKDQESGEGEEDGTHLDAGVDVPPAGGAETRWGEGALRCGGRRACPVAHSLAR
jgi:hypothetical protein